MPMTFRRKVDIVTDYLSKIGSLDFDAAGQHLADDAVMMVPFAPSVEAVPPLVGKGAILDQMRGVMQEAFVRMDFTIDEWYDVSDSDALVAEYHSVCPLKGPRGQRGEYRNSYVGVFRFADDKITLHKEYFNPIELTALAAPGGE
ncbi:nuclear transport factor 2 family protein [Mycobacterium sp. SMC-2]|uniref:nuclear transport factor 2 family protein n=1 Tax=Mycobacterium sp. SMC-2 TaxID=2857058 RepID=UPI0021B19283|nr:nuclear transport factor 2 family protein [Mycobacterium sp. SMC-2]UXA06096.1 nuclear transport factor 2 family protein [Mycobacterium sp. SMC-2]